MLSENIYYVDEEILKKIESDFELIEKKNWYLLYRNRENNSFWRLDEWDKYQIQLLVKLESAENWVDFNDLDLRLNLLREQRGVSNDKCKWKDCDKKALNNLVFCELHAYEEMGIRK